MNSSQMEQTCLIVPREAFYTTQLAVFKLGANGYAVFCWLGFLGIVAASIFPVEKGATCHVYVNEQWLGKEGELSPTEEAMLSLSTDRKDNSRLSCQIQVTEELDGLVVTTPEFQF